MANRVGLIGLGKLGSCIAKALHQNTSLNSLFFEKSEERKRLIQKELGLTIVESLKDIVQSSEILILCVKPDQLPILLEEISALEPGKEKVFVSTCAGVTISQIKSGLGGQANVLRVMPNIAVFAETGITAISYSKEISQSDMTSIEGVFRAMGEVLFIDEQRFDEFTAICASGPAFVFDFLRAFESFALSKGFSLPDSQIMATQLVQGVAALLQGTSNSLDAWIAQVATPGGCTEAGLKKAKEINLEQDVHSILQATSIRSSELSLRDD